MKKSEFDSMIHRLEESGRIVSSSAQSGNRIAEVFHLGAGKPVKKERVPKVEVFVPVPESIQMNMKNNVTPATLPELLNWKNQNGITFIQDSQSSLWVMEQDIKKLTPEIEAAILENQDTLKMFLKIPEQPTIEVSYSPDDIELDADSEAFFLELQAM